MYSGPREETIEGASFQFINHKIWRKQFRQLYETIQNNKTILKEKYILLKMPVTCESQVQA